VVEGGVFVFLKKLLSFIRKPSVSLAFGWLPDPPDVEQKDWQVSETQFGHLGLVSDEMDNSVYFRPVSDQQRFPSCSANACVDAWESAVIAGKTKAGMALEEAIRSTPDLSRMFAWWYGRNAMDPPQSSNASSGCYLRLIMDTLTRFGTPSEATWPYTQENATLRPSIKAQREAFLNRSDAFYNIKERGDDLFNILQRLLAERHSVAFGTLVGQDFMTYRSGVLQPPTGGAAGHALVVVGWSSMRNAFKVRNSWGPAWGQEGHCWMSRKYICEYSGTGCFWVVTKGAL
jgi:hypothetical protein